MRLTIYLRGAVRPWHVAIMMAHHQEDAETAFQKRKFKLTPPHEQGKSKAMTFTAERSSTADRPFEGYVLKLQKGMLQL